MSEDTSGLSDREVIDRVVDGDVNAFEHIISRYRKYVFKIVMKHVPSDYVEETAHDAFVRAYQALPTYRGKGEFRHWLAKIATRTSYDFLRRRYRSIEVPMTDLNQSQERWLDRSIARGSEASSEDEVSRREATEVLHWALNQLSAEDRMVIQLIYLDELSVKEAAGMLGWSRANVKVRAFRSRRKLRKILSRLIEKQGDLG